jgi:C4-dicarboxylate transporter/malic acid transport protein
VADGDSMRTHPGWYGAVMATAVLSLIAHNERIIWGASWLDVLAVTLLLMTTLLAVVLGPRYFRRLRTPGFARDQLGDPDTGSMLATVPAGLLLLGGAWGTVGPLIIPVGAALTIDAALTVVGAVLALWVGMMWATSTGRGSKGLAGVNGSWLIPPVCTMLVATAIAPLVRPNPGIADVLLLIGYGFLGAGLIMFVVMLALLVARLVLHPNLRSALAPTMWIPLAPAGILGIAAIRLTQGAVGVGLVDPATVDMAAVVAALAFGFGAWWALFAAIDLARMRQAGVIAFHPGWWAFVFPPAALLLSLLGIEELFHSDHLKWLSAPLCLALLVLWGYLVVKSLARIRS